ncbi:hypothetical protein GCM10025734_36380 [Kitasatospora paranensis]
MPAGTVTLGGVMIAPPGRRPPAAPRAAAPTGRDPGPGRSAAVRGSGVRRPARVVAPVPAGADAATGFTLTAQSAGAAGRNGRPGPGGMPPARAGPCRFSGRPPPRSAG